MKKIRTFSFMKFWIKNSVNKPSEPLNSIVHEIKWAHQMAWRRWAQVKANFFGKKFLSLWKNKDLSMTFMKFWIRNSMIWINLIYYPSGPLNSIVLKEIEWAHHMAWGRWAHSQSSFSWEIFLACEIIRTFRWHSWNSELKIA